MNTLSLFLLFLLPAAAFVSPRHRPRSSGVLYGSSSSVEDVVRAALQLPDATQPVSLVGRSFPGNVTCAVLAPTTETPGPCLLVPLSDDDSLALEHPKRPLSSWQIYRATLQALNTGSLWDNLPWAEWTVDPSQLNRDAATNPLLAKYHPGKRDAYNRLTGGRLQRRSRVKPPTTVVSLQDRVNQVELRELQMELAEVEYQLAIARQQQPKADGDDRVAALERDRTALLQAVQRVSRDPTTTPSSLWDRFWNKQQQDSKPPAPYPGATGYAQWVQTGTSTTERYTSPYEAILAVVRDQLHAEVIGTVLENIRFLEGNLVAGGVVVLQRRTATKTIQAAGETLSLPDENEDFGNPGVRGGTVFLVDCSADEVIALSMVSGTPLEVERDLWMKGSVMAQRDGTDTDSSTELDTWSVLDPELSVLIEGQATKDGPTERRIPLRLPRSSISLFDSLFRADPSAPKNSTLFPTDNPIKTLEQFDELGNEEKARTLMSMSNFENELPRPRAVRQSPANANPLDALLLPLIDESVRRQYRIRDAELRGDLELAKELREAKSSRQVAKERATEALANDRVEVAEAWEQEADFLGSLRADVTQDEGSYSRFLDKDDWYERERQKTAKRVNRKQFGSLLDGIE